PDYAGDPQLSSKRLDSIDQPDESGPFVRVGTTDSVVGNREAQGRTIGLDVHPPLGCLCVFCRVRERFRDNVIGGDFGGIGQPLVNAEVKFHRYGRAARQCVQRWAQSAFGKKCRMNTARYLLEIFRYAPQPRNDVRNLCPQWVAFGRQWRLT